MSFYLFCCFCLLCFKSFVIIKKHNLNDSKSIIWIILIYLKRYVLKIISNFSFIAFIHVIHFFFIYWKPCWLVPWYTEQTYKIDSSNICHLIVLMMFSFLNITISKWTIIWNQNYLSLTLLFKFIVKLWSWYQRKKSISHPLFCEWFYLYYVDH